MAALRALLFGDPVHLRAAHRVLVCAGATVHAVQDIERVVAEAERFEPSLVLVELPSCTERCLFRLERLAALPTAPTIILLAAPSPPERLAKLLEAPWCDHLLGLESPWFMAELGVTVAKLHGQPIFDVSKYLPWGTRFVEVPIEGSASKQVAFDRIEAFMDALGVRGRMIARLQAVADELLMNAIYDAPVDRRSGEPRYHGLHRSSPVVLAPDEQPTLRFGSDGRIFAISVSDPFGGLSPATLKRYVAKGLRRGDDQIDDKIGGAGLGLFLLFESLGSLIVDVHRGRRTEVMGLLDIQGSFRDAVRTPKSLNIFQRQG
jgi:hypothetical protein